MLIKFSIHFVCNSTSLKILLLFAIKTIQNETLQKSLNVSKGFLYLNKEVLTDYF